MDRISYHYQQTSHDHPTIENGDICSISQLFQMLLGTWRLERTLGRQGNMQGTAKFQKTNRANLYHYQEVGTISLEKGKQLSAYREYAYIYQDHQIMVHFWDPIQKQPGKLLHTLQFIQPFPQPYPIHAYNTHICKLDRYQAHYVFDNDHAFQLHYTVNGPCKDFTIQTCLFRNSQLTE